MEYSYDDIYLFVKVVECESFTATTKILNIAQSTISRRMGVLEKSLGLKLFQHNQGKSFCLTDAGELLYAKFKHQKYEVDNFINKVTQDKDNPKGRLKIILPPVFAIKLITPHLPDFCLKYPDINLEVAYQNIEFDLVKNDFDFAILNHLPRQQNQKITKILTLAFGLYCTKQYKDTYGIPETPEELSSHMVTSFLFDDYTPQKNFDFIHSKTGDVIVIEAPDKNIAINNAVQGYKMMFSNKIIVAAFPQQVDAANEDIIRVLPEYMVGNFISYYMIRHPFKNRYATQTFAEFILSLMPTPRNLSQGDTLSN